MDFKAFMDDVRDAVKAGECEIMAANGWVSARGETWAGVLFGYVRKADGREHFGIFEDESRSDFWWRWYASVGAPYFSYA